MTPDYVCPVTNRLCKGLSECKVDVKELPKRCVDKFETAFKFFGVK